MRNPFFSIRGGRSFVVATKTHLLIQGGVQIDLGTVFDAILTNRQTCEKLQCVYENLMSNNFRKTAVPKKKMTCKLKLQNKGLCLKNFGAHPEEDRIVSHDAFFQKHHAISQS